LGKQKGTSILAEDGGRETGTEETTMRIETAKDLEVYQLAYRISMRIFGRLGSMIKNPGPFLISDH
jgi:hypothetical protein